MRLFFVGRYPVDLLWRVWTTLGIIVSLGGFSWGIFARASRLFNRTSLIILGIGAAICVAVTFSAGLHYSLLLLGMLILLVVGAVLGQQVGRLIPSLSAWLSMIWLLSFFVVLWLLEGGLLCNPADKVKATQIAAPIPRIIKLVWLNKREARANIPQEKPPKLTIIPRVVQTRQSKSTG